MLFMRTLPQEMIKLHVYLDDLPDDKRKIVEDVAESNAIPLN